MPFKNLQAWDQGPKNVVTGHKRWKNAVFKGADAEIIIMSLKALFLWENRQKAFTSRDPLIVM